MNGRASVRTTWDPIVRHYESCLAEHGASPMGVGLRNGADLAARFGVMLDLIDGIDRPMLVDVGCGPGLLLDYLAATGGTERIQYQGIDLSEKIINVARARWPSHRFTCRDITEQLLAERSVDVVLINGLLTKRFSLGLEAMTSLAQSLTLAAFRCARVGIAFNVTSAHVDQPCHDDFQWPFNTLASFLEREVSNRFSFHADYGLDEYTCLVRR
jgi:SAM-dependent methyltransferase